MGKKSIWIIRVIFCAITWAVLIYNFASSNSPLFLLLFYTIQSNILVGLWLLLAVLWEKKPEKYHKISGVIRGGVTLYITVTFIIFALLLAPIMPPEYAFNVTNILEHYIIPVYFIVDWILTEKIVRYRWNYLWKWIIYPLCYLIFTLMYGLFTGFYPYFFIDPSVMGELGYGLAVAGLTAFYLGLGSIFILINHKLSKNPTA